MRDGYPTRLCMAPVSTAWTVCGLSMCHRPRSHRGSDISLWPVVHMVSTLSIRLLALGEEMREEFVQQIDACISLVRNREFRELGKSPLAEQLRPILQEALPYPLQECSPVIIGEALHNVFARAIESMLPLNMEDIERDSPQRRRYVYLKEYVLHGEAWEPVAHEELSVSRSKFYEIRRDALDVLAKTLWHWKEEKSEMQTLIFCNLGRPPYTKFVQRYNDDGLNYIDQIIIPELCTGRAWIVALQGKPGVGKSSLAYAVAERCSESPNDSMLPFDAVILIPCRPQEYLPGKDEVRIHSRPTSMSEIFEEIGKTLHNREVLQCLEEEKREVVHGLLQKHACLIVLDNVDSEWLPDDLLRGIEAFIQTLPPPHKALVTMRQEQMWEGQHTIPVKKMQKSELATLMQETGTRGLVPFTAPEFDQVYQKTNGNPLAMKQTLSLTRLFDYSLEDALAFDQQAPLMLEFMYGKAYDRLSISAKKMLALLPLFVDPAPVHALEHISEVTGPTKAMALGQLYRGHMIEKTGEDAYGSERYSLLPFARDFLRKARRGTQRKIENKPMAEYLEAAYPRMINYYQQLLDDFSDRIDQTLLLLTLEKETIFSLMDWCRNNDHESLIKYFDAIGIPLGILRYLRRRTEWGERIVHVCKDLDRHQDADWYLVRDVAWSLVRMGTEDSRARALKLLIEAKERATDNEWTRNLALILRNLATLATDNNDYDKAQEYLNTSVMLWQRVDEPFFETITRAAMASLAMRRKNLKAAEDFYRPLLQDYQRLGDINGKTQVMASLAAVAAQQGHYANAHTMSNSSIELAEQIEDPAYIRGFVYHTRSEIEELQNNLEQAIEWDEKATAVYKALGMSYYVDKLQQRIKDLKLRVPEDAGTTPNRQPTAS